MVLTFDTSHLEMSPLNALALENMNIVLVMRDTSHSAIGPCTSWEQSPPGDSLMHASTAVWSSFRDCGEKTKGMMLAVVSCARDSLMHAPTAVWSASRDCGEKAKGMVLAVVSCARDIEPYSHLNMPFLLAEGMIIAVVYFAADIEPDDPLNMSFLMAFEWTQAAPQRFCLKDVAPQNM